MVQDPLKPTDGMLNAMGHMVTIRRINQRIADRRDHADAIRRQTAQLETANRDETDRTQVERQRLEIERQRLQADEAERGMQREQAELIKQLRNLMADSFSMLERMRKEQPICR